MIIQNRKKNYLPASINRTFDVLVLAIALQFLVWVLESLVDNKRRLPLGMLSLYMLRIIMLVEG